MAITRSLLNNKKSQLSGRARAAHAREGALHLEADWQGCTWVSWDTSQYQITSRPALHAPMVRANLRNWAITARSHAAVVGTQFQTHQELARKASTDSCSTGPCRNPCLLGRNAKRLRSLFRKSQLAGLSRRFAEELAQQGESGEEPCQGPRAML